MAGYSNTIGQEMIELRHFKSIYIWCHESGWRQHIFRLTANAITNVPVPQSVYVGNVESKISNKGIHITSLLPIVVYAHIYDLSISGVTLVLSANTLGKD